MSNVTVNSIIQPLQVFFLPSVYLMFKKSVLKSDLNLGSEM